MQLETVWEWPDGIEAAYRQLFSSVPEGVSWLALHFNAPGEVELFDTEAHIRVGECEFFCSGQASELMAEFGLVPIGVKQWREAMRR